MLQRQPQVALGIVEEEHGPRERQLVGSNSQQSVLPPDQALAQRRRQQEAVEVAERAQLQEQQEAAEMAEREWQDQLRDEEKGNRIVSRS